MNVRHSGFFLKKKPRSRKKRCHPLKEISINIHFFKFLKNVKKWHLTWKSWIFLSVWYITFPTFQKGSKISRNSFCIIPNTIWTRFDWFREIWKLLIFLYFSIIFWWFLHVKYWTNENYHINFTCKFGQKSLKKSYFHQFLFNFCM